VVALERKPPLHIAVLLPCLYLTHTLLLLYGVVNGSLNATRGVEATLAVSPMEMTFPSV
jgi:hypothetical protein